MRRLERDELYQKETIDDEVDEKEENIFDNLVESAIPTTYSWSKQYTPRRPKYINHVQAGYEWNRYNQTHFDRDNPPPKTIHGYKFNIFYPNLVDPRKTPTYRIERQPGTDETVLLRFSAGAPYEDLVFKIVNRAWERSDRFGFRCKFDRGVLQLHIRFRRLQYRR